MQVYEFINPSDAWTFLASSDKVAFIVAIMVGRGQTAARREGWEAGMYFFGGDFEADYLKQFNEPFEGAMKRHEKEIVKSLKSFMIHRERSKKKLTGKALFKWNDQLRSSLSDWGGYANRLAAAMEKGKTEKVKA